MCSRHYSKKKTILKDLQRAESLAERRERIKLRVNLKLFGQMLNLNDKRSKNGKTAEAHDKTFGIDWTSMDVATLIKLAADLNLGLKVEFTPLSDLLEHVRPKDDKLHDKLTGQQIKRDADSLITQLDLLRPREAA